MACYMTDTGMRGYVYESSLLYSMLSLDDIQIAHEYLGRLFKQGLHDI